MLNQQELTQTELFVLHQNLVKLILVSIFFLQFELLFLSLRQKSTCKPGSIHWSWDIDIFLIYKVISTYLKIQIEFYPLTHQNDH